MICRSCGHSNLNEAVNCTGCQKQLYRARLRVAFESGKSQTYYLHPKSYTIGREPNNDIYIDDVSVSRYHAELYFADDAFSINDKQSKNGSLLNSENFTTRKLRDMDYIQLGNVMLHFRDEDKLTSSQLYTTEEFIREEFFRVAERSPKGFATGDILAAMLKLVISLLHVDRAFLYQQNDSEKLTFRFGCDADGTQKPAPHLSDAEQSLIKQAANSGDPTARREYLASFTLNNHERKTWQWLAFPVLAIKTDDSADTSDDRAATLGVCLFVSNATGTLIEIRKYELLETLMQQISLTLHNELLYGEAVEKRRIKSELSLARKIQQKLLPTEFPNIHTFEIISFFQPCEQISGDYFDVIPMSNNHIAIAIGDICGKGIPAALLSSTVKADVRAQVEYTASPEQIIGHLNRFLIQNTANSIFLTLFFGILNTETGELKYINAGHPPAILISKNQKVTELSGTTPALGIIEPEFKQERTIAFERGDMLLMYTDGLIESQNKEKQIYGRKRFTEVIHSLLSEKKTGKLGLQSIVTTIQQDVKEFITDCKQADDLTFLALRRR